MDVPVVHLFSPNKTFHSPRNVLPSRIGGSLLRVTELRKLLCDRRILVLPTEEVSRVTIPGPLTDRVTCPPRDLDVGSHRPSVRNSSGVYTPTYLPRSQEEVLETVLCLRCKDSPLTGSEVTGGRPKPEDEWFPKSGARGSCSCVCTCVCVCMYVSTWVCVRVGGVCKRGTSLCGCVFVCGSMYVRTYRSPNLREFYHPVPNKKVPK